MEGPRPGRVTPGLSSHVGVPGVEQPPKCEDQGICPVLGRSDSSNVIFSKLFSQNSSCLRKSICTVARQYHSFRSVSPQWKAFSIISDPVQLNISSAKANKSEPVSDVSHYTAFVCIATLAANGKSILINKQPLVKS